MTMLPIHVAETPGTSTPPLRRSPEAVASGDVHHGENTTTKKRVLTKPRVVRRTSSATRLRSNLFYKLGLPPKEDAAAARVVSRASPGSLLRHAKVEHIPLSGNGDDDDDNDTEPQDEGRDEHLGACRAGTTDKVLHAMGALWSPLGRDSLTERSTTSASSSSSSHDDDNHRHVHFCPQVSVIPIPTRHDYSNRIRGFLWPTATELQTNVLRNTLEFSADGWDWNGVLEEDGHYYNPATKEYIHPIHLEIAQMPFEEQQLLGVTDRYINPALAG